MKFKSLKSVLTQLARPVADPADGNIKTTYENSSRYAEAAATLHQCMHNDATSFPKWVQVHRSTGKPLICQGTPSAAEMVLLHIAGIRNRLRHDFKNLAERQQASLSNNADAASCEMKIEYAEDEPVWFATLELGFSEDDIDAYINSRLEKVSGIARGHARVETAPVSLYMPGKVQSTAAFSSEMDGDWIPRAQTRANEIIKEEKDNDRYPSQLAIADRISREFRDLGLVGASGKPITGAYIKRHALKGINSAVGKKFSTTKSWGK